MWWVKENSDNDFGPEYVMYYARYADPPNLGNDILVHNCFFIFPFSFLNLLQHQSRPDWVHTLKFLENK